MFNNLKYFYRKIYNLLSTFLNNIKLNYPYLYLLIHQIIGDFYNIYYFFLRIYYWDFYISDYFPNITQVIIKFILFILFILPGIWAIKISIFIYKMFITYIFLILDFLFIDIIFRKINIFKLIYLKIRAVMYYFFYELWFVLLFDWLEILREYYTWENISYRWIERLGRFISFFVRRINKIILFVRRIFLIHIPKIRRLTKLAISFYTTNTKKIELYIIFRKEWIYWHIIRIPGWTYKFIKNKIKYFYRWFRRWIRMVIPWYYIKIKIMSSVFIEKLFKFVFAIFFFDIRKKKIAKTIRVIDVTYRVFWWNFDIYIKLPRKKIYKWFINTFYKSLSRMCYYIVCSRHYLRILKINCKICYIKTKMFFFLYWRNFLDVVIPHKILYYIQFFMDGYYNKFYRKRDEERIINYMYNQVIISFAWRAKSDYYFKRYLYYRNYFLSKCINKYDFKAKDLPIIRDTELISFIFVWIATIIHLFIDLLKFLLFIWLCYSLLVKFGFLNNIFINKIW